MIKKVSNYSCAGFLLGLWLFWLAGAYITTEPNPMNWHQVSRLLHVYFSLVVSVGAALWACSNGEEN